MRNKQAIHGGDILPILIMSCWMIVEMPMIDRVCVLITGAGKLGGHLAGKSRFIAKVRDIHQVML